MSKKMPAGQSSGHMTIRAGSLKATWLAHCRARKTSSANLLRKLMSAELSANGEGHFNENDSDFVINDSKEIRRLELQVPLDICEALNELTAKEGFPTLNRYAVALLAVKATGSPQLNLEEFKALVSSNRQMMAIGRNLNQLVIDVKTANAANADLSVIGNFRFGVLEQLREQISRHTTLVRQVLAANITRWNA